MTPTARTVTGAIARAMASVHEQHDPRADVSGRIECPWCRSGLRFTILSNGLSRGHCTSCRLRWDQ